MAAAGLLISISSAHAQDKRGPDGPTFYRVQFRIRDGNNPSSQPVRTYALVTAANRKATFKVGDRVPVSTASYQPSSPGANTVTQFTYIDTGVTIECIVGNEGSKLVMHGNIDLSSVDRHEGGPGGNPNPTVAQTRLELDTAVDPGKPTVIASIEDTVNQRKLQIEATVTKVD